jgi:hypothetical protein
VHAGSLRQADRTFSAATSAPGSPATPELAAGLEFLHPQATTRPENARIPLILIHGAFVAARSAGALFYEPFSSSSSSGRRRKGA